MKSQQLDEGQKVNVSHLRAVKDGLLMTSYYWHKHELEPNPRGGLTIVHILDKDGNMLARGTARCSELDQYNKKIGRSIALGRALKKMSRPDYAPVPSSQVDIDLASIANEETVVEGGDGEQAS